MRWQLIVLTPLWICRFFYSEVLRLVLEIIMKKSILLIDVCR